ncbi:universal stress protein [Mumia zhuanghuii]|uniref:Universal stress protein n=2 Tax=Mumia TaxID=1546255 RepID=A0ABW1QK90_9ACTN|nr:MULTISPECIES: universal stress protein [Mumia]KAA1418277.1 universal stress protein [Mumia zhuanghuii]
MTVLVAYVDTAEGNAAFEAAVEEAAHRGEPLVVLNSPRPGAPVDAHLVTDDRAAALRRRTDEAGVELDLRQTPHHEDLVPVLEEVAAEVGASVLVIGIKRRSPVGKLLLGSTAQRILLHITIPVLAVKPADRRA